MRITQPSEENRDCERDEKMRNIKKRAAAIASAAALTAGYVLPAVPASEAMAEPRAGTNIRTELPAFRQDPDTGEFETVQVFEAAEESTDILAAAEGFPSSFDLRDEGGVSPVRRQSGYGTCWAHSACASAESSLLAAEPDIDLSEFHPAYYAYDETDQIDLGLGTLSEKLNFGGSADIVTNLWAQWIGPVKESRLPYGDEEFFSTDGVYDMKYTADYHLKEARIFDYNWERTNTEEVNAQIKECVMEGMPVDIAFCNNSSEYYNAAYHCTNSKKRPKFSNHSVVIVGWDDDFSKERFKIQPENNGAWLCKNSWGPNYAENGYIWISYEDTSVSECYSFVISDKDDYRYNNQHDSYIPVNAISASDSVEDDTGSYMASVFTSYTDQLIGAVATYIVAPDTEYEITIYTGLTDKSDPTSGTASAVTKGVCEKTGYYTLELDSDVPVSAGTDYSAVVKLYSPESNFVVPVESCFIVRMGEDNYLDLSGYTNLEDMTRNTGELESFVSGDLVEWTDMGLYENKYDENDEQDVLESLRKQLYDGIEPDDEEGLADAEKALEGYREIFAEGESASIFGNVALKVLGKEPGTVDFSRSSGQVPPGETVELSGNDGGEIRFSINGGAEQTYTAPIEITEKMTISATSDGVHYSDRTYEPAKASVMGIGWQAGTSNGVHSVNHATKTGENEYLIEMGVTGEGLRLYPETYSTVTMNGKELMPFALSDYIETGYGETVLELELSQEGLPDSTVTLTIQRLPYKIDMEAETITFVGMDSLTAPDGTDIPDGGSLSDYAGQTLTGKAGDTAFDVKVPARYDLTGLTENYRMETLDGIPGEIADLLEISVTGEDFVSASSRLTGSTNSDDYSLNIIPGEAISLRTRAGAGYFAGIPVGYKLSEAPAAPEKIPAFTFKEGKFTFERSETEAALFTQVSADIQELADSFCYSDTELLTSALEKRFGTTDRSTDAAGLSWSGIGDIAPGDTVAVRYPATDRSYASKLLIVRLNQMGDVDGNGIVDSTDASDVLVHFAATSTGGSGTLPQEMKPFADMDGDSAIDSADASEILIIYAGAMTAATGQT